MINSEFQPLKEMIVGTSYLNHTCMIEGLDQVIEETNEDCRTLADILTELGVKVLRPKQKAFNKEVHHPIMPRDVFGFYGNKMIQTYGAIHSRQEELICYDEILNAYKDKIFIKMARPDINETEETEYTEAHSNKIKVQQRYDKYKDLCLWETANMIKCGEHILHTQSADKDPTHGKGTEVGLQFMKEMLPEFEFIELPAGGHIDGKLALLRPGLLLTWRKEFIPDALKNWDAIIVKDKALLPSDFKKTRKQRFYKDYVLKYLSDWTGYCEETYFDVNCISVNEDTIVTAGSEKENIKQIEKHGINVIRWKHRHRYFWDGGVHCFTQDTVRNGSRERYL